MPKNFFRVKYRKTKKRRVCCECSKIILKGTTYAMTVGRTMGDFHYAAICEQCGHYLEEHNKPDPEPKPRGLVF